MCGLHAQSGGHVDVRSHAGVSETQTDAKEARVGVRARAADLTHRRPGRRRDATRAHSKHENKGFPTCCGVERDGRRDLSIFRLL